MHETSGKQKWGSALPWEGPSPTSLPELFLHTYAYDLNRCHPESCVFYKRPPHTLRGMPAAQTPLPLPAKGSAGSQAACQGKVPTLTGRHFYVFCL